MARRFSSGPRVPEVVDCAGCGRKLVTASYLGHPVAGVPAERITERIAPLWPPFSVACTCGHYTVFRPQRPSFTPPPGSS